jgi:hypothetical protein
MDQDVDEPGKRLGAHVVADPGRQERLPEDISAHTLAVACTRDQDGARVVVVRDAE